MTISLIIVCGIYPLVLWMIGQSVFSFQANGSLLLDSRGKAIGSMLVAQPFVQDEYFHSRPSAAAYNASASASSALSVSNYALRDRVARTLGPIVKYQDGRSVGPDIEKWFQSDKFQGRPNIVAQWAMLHPLLAQAWVNESTMHKKYVSEWAKAMNTGSTNLAVAFFQSFSKENPGKFPALANVIVNGKAAAKIAAVNTGAEIQAIFFDMWRQDHPDAILQNVPGDFVTTSASGLDPHITLQNAEFQLDRIAAKWAVKLNRNPVEVKAQIEKILRTNAHAPWMGLIGEKVVNVLEVNLALRNAFDHT